MRISEGCFKLELPTISWFRSNLTNRNLAILILVIMNTQFVFIEGYAISPIKVGIMATMPLFFFTRVPFVSKALVLGVVFWSIILLSSALHPDTFRFSTLGYLAMFVITYVVFFNLVHTGAFTLDDFISIVRALILAYVICLICQQVLVLIGIRFMPLVNLNNQFFLSIHKLPSLSIEPSHSARIMGCLFYAYLKCNEYKQGESISFYQCFNLEHRYVSIGFLWAMLTMGSGTAFIALGLLSIYFINWRNALLVIPLILSLINVASYFELSQFERAYNVARATATLDNEIVAEADGSAYARIAPMVNTVKHLDLSKTEHWLGQGIDSGNKNKKDKMIAEISDYGFLAYIIGLILVFSCSINFLSIPTVMYFAGIAGSTGNIAYGWGILMIFTCIRYLKNRHE